MKYLFLFAFACAACHAPAPKENQIVIGTIDSVYSTRLKEKRKIWVHVPDKYRASTSPKQQYPVVYLLDGDAHFQSLTGVIQQLSEVNGNTILPEMIVVGILNTDRLRDLTPTHTDLGYDEKRDASMKTSGGGEKFTDFIQKELMPHIDSLYPTAPYRLLIGHSLGGLMVVNTLLTRPNLFNAYLAIDPSMWWDHQKLLKRAETELKEKKLTGKTLFLAMANTMEPGMDTIRVRKDTAAGTLHIRSIMQLSDALKTNAQDSLTWDYKYYPKDGHSAVPLIAEYDALRFIFNFYAPPSLEKFFEPASTPNIDSTLTAHYRTISYRLGYAVLPPESSVNGLGYAFLQSKRLDNAYACFAMNIRNYQNSFNAYDSMGDYYHANKDKQKAIEYYTRSLAIKEQPSTREKLNKLKGEK